MELAVYLSLLRFVELYEKERLYLQGDRINPKDKCVRNTVIGS